jgi:hypothetical protein
VPHGDRRDAQVQEPRLEVELGVAHAGGLDPHTDLAFARIRTLNIIEPERLPRAVIPYCLHG